jgi:ubiquinone/menaquinone biosynthesis C-methylase UbiE
MPHDPMSDFRMFAFYSAFRDFFHPPRNTLAVVGIKRGDTVLDFGCGRGGFSVAAAEIVGPEGKVYALDVHPLAIKLVRTEIRRRGLANVETIHADAPTDLADESVDVVLLYDVFHDLASPETVLAELARVMKPEAVLSVTDHHLKAEELIPALRQGGHFQFSKKNKPTYEFAKKGVAGVGQ